ncbi:MAG: hypothetical protein JNL45_15540 [Hyphomicrobium sp.]|nr:hypothetical protein [Hyphomicrobium sp.]
MTQMSLLLAALAGGLAPRRWWAAALAGAAVYLGLQYGALGVRGGLSAAVDMARTAYLMVGNLVFAEPLAGALAGLAGRAGVRLYTRLFGSHDQAS